MSNLGSLASRAGLSPSRLYTYYGNSSPNLQNSRNMIGLIGTGINALGSLFGGIGSAASSRRQIKAQQQENQKNREWNFMLAKYQNAENLAQWNRENAYNDPSAQMSRLRGAGLNPDLMYQNGTTGLTAASSPEMTSGQGSEPSQISQVPNLFSTLGQSMQAGIQQYATQAAIKKTDAETKKIKEETKGQQIENQFAPALKNQEIELNDTKITLNVTSGELNRGMTNYYNNFASKVAQDIEAGKFNLQKLEAQMPYIDRMAWAEYCKSEYAVSLMSQQIENMSYLNQQEKARAKYAAQYALAQLTVMQNQGSMYEALTNFHNAMKDGVMWDNKFKERKYNWKSKDGENSTDLELGSLYYDYKSGQFQYGLDVQFGERDRELAQSLALANIAETYVRAGKEFTDMLMDLFAAFLTKGASTIGRNNHSPKEPPKRSGTYTYNWNTGNWQ